MANRPLYLQKHTTRHGEIAWYVRLPGKPLVRIKGEYGSEDFQAQYRAALAGAPSCTAKSYNSKSLHWLYDRYRESLAWTRLSPATRRQRENIFAHVMKIAGHEPFLAIESADIAASIDAMRETPSQARNYLDAMTGLFRWAKANAHVTADPTRGVERPRRPRNGKGFHVWDEADVALFCKRWPVGTRERLWFELLAGTGLRRGDAVRAGKQHIKDGVLSLETEKTGTVAHAVISPELRAILYRGPTSDLAFICGKKGQPLTKETFGNMFKAACVAAGLKERSAHGIRKFATTQDAESGHSERELEAKYGWTGGQMASHYTRSANRKALVKNAAARVLPDRSKTLSQNSGNEISDLEAPESLLVRSRKVE